MLEQPDPRRLALVMVGLPARGKTYVARKISRYLSWLGIKTQNFNVGDYRRSRLGGQQPARFFDPDNPEGKATRRELALAALDDMLDWFDSGGEVGIYDATNSTRKRRERVYNRCKEKNVQVVFVESICDEGVVEANIRETKLRSPDYADMDPDEAVLDFRRRIAHYERVYETIDDQDKSYVKLIDVGRQVVVNRMEGYLSARLIFFLMNIHAARRRIWLTRHGESEFNLLRRIGGDADLTDAGIEYARSLGRFLKERHPEGEVVRVWTSTLKRTIQTAAHMGVQFVSLRALNEIHAGVCDGMTYEQIRRRMPDEFKARKANKFRYRYPRGESYADVIQRLEPVIVELERQRSPVMVVGHQAVLRALYGYLMGIPQEECPFIKLPLHTAIQLTPTAYGYDEQRFALAPDLGEERSASSSG